MNLSPQLRSELVTAMDRGPRSRRAPLLLAPIVLIVALGLLLPRTDDSERAVQPAPVTWTPVLGDDQRGYATVANAPIPPEQLAALSVLRRPQTEADRGPQVEALLKVLGAGNAGVHLDGVRLLARHGQTLTVLVPMQRLSRGSRTMMRDALCLLRGPYPAGGGSGMHCATYDDLVNRQIGWPRPPFGLVPDGIARVTVRVRGGKALHAPVRDNVYDLTEHPDAVAIQPPRWLDRDNDPIHRPWRAGQP